MLEGGTNASFLAGALGFIRYDRVRISALLLGVMGGAVLAAVWRGRWASEEPLRENLLGVWSALAAGTVGVIALSWLLARVDNRFSAASLGDPLGGLVESGVDLVLRRSPASPRELVLDAHVSAKPNEGAALLGWPPAHAGPHPHARALDFEKEPAPADPRGRRLLQALRRVGGALFSPGDSRLAVFFLSLEGFRADDLHALNAHAPREIAPYLSALYAQPGVLSSKQMFQAGVRTAHCLGAMTCGLGTLPYNLSFIRDLQPISVRCTSDVLSDSGFAHSFFYGSDAGFDDMRRFFTSRGYRRVVSQAELPSSLPKGTWDAVTDFALFDVAARDTATALEQGPQFSLVMSLSNHSPFTTPQDLPEAVRERVDQVLKSVPNRASAEDRLRLLTYSYTDAAVERFVGKLEELGLAERSIVVLSADHSTGHSYVWGPQEDASDAAKAKIPFAIILPPALRARATNPSALEAAMKEAQALISEAPLSQNDAPSLLLALLAEHPSLRALPAEKRWHTLGGQVTSPYFAPGGDAASYLLGINGVSELFALDRHGVRVGDYEDSVFLKTRADRYRVTPRLIPVTSALIEAMKENP